MKFLMILILCGFITACSGTKTATTSKPKTHSNNPKTNSLKNAPVGKIDTSETTSKKAAEIIEKYTKYALKDIARSQIIKTKNGYWWKFSNVRYGQKFIVTTDSNFNNVQIKKQIKKKT